MKFRCSSSIADDTGAKRQLERALLMVAGIALLDSGRQLYLGSTLAWIDLAVTLHMIGVLLCLRRKGDVASSYILAATGAQAGVVLFALMDPAKALYLFLFPIASLLFLGLRHGILFTLSTTLPAMLLMVVRESGPSRLPGGFFDYFAAFALLLFFSLVYERDRNRIQQGLKESNHILEKDIEEVQKRQTEQEGLLIQQSKYAELGEMIGAIAHQWRQPLNTMAILIQDMEDAFEGGDLTREYIRDSVSKTMEQILFMSSTIDDFRNFLRPSGGPGVFHGAKAIKEVHSLLLAQLQFNYIETGIRCSASSEEIHCTKENLSGPCLCSVAPSLFLRGYQNEFKQAILNILNNSKDAILEKRQQKGDSVSSDRIDIHICREAERLLVLIEDSGIGIDEAIQGKIFDPHFTTKGEGAGTGVGLFLVKQVIQEKMHGTIRTERSASGGARMVMELPSVLDEEIRQLPSS